MVISIEELLLTRKKMLSNKSIYAVGYNRSSAPWTSFIKKKLNGKKAMVTGAASGIGLAIAEVFASSGAAVALWDLSDEALSKAKEKITSAYKVPCITVAVDVSDSEAVQAAMDATVNALGGLDIAVNNAGIGSLGSVEDENYEMFRKVQEIDVDSIFHGCKYAIPLMREHGLGSIVNISSIAGIIASGNYIAYNTAKAAVRHMSKSIALHCAKTGGQIRCNSVHPVFINTPILDHTKEMFGEEEALKKLGRSS